MNYIYIHGFNSGIGSRTGAALEALLGQPVFCVANDYSKPFAECLKACENQILSRYAQPASLCVMGTSLGGFYALELRLAGIARVAAWNPVIYPALQLAPFIGANTRFTDGHNWHFSREVCRSYAQAADPRQWRNFTLEAKYGASPQPAVPARHIWFGSQDEVLDYRLGVAFWQNHAALDVVEAAHSLEDFSAAIPFLKGAV